MNVLHLLLKFEKLLRSHLQKKHHSGNPALSDIAPKPTKTSNFYKQISAYQTDRLVTLDILHHANFLPLWVIPDVSVWTREDKFKSGEKICVIW